MNHKTLIMLGGPENGKFRKVRTPAPEDLEIFTGFPDTGCPRVRYHLKTVWYQPMDRKLGMDFVEAYVLDGIDYATAFRLYRDHGMAS